MGSSGLELLADELVTLSNPQQTSETITTHLQNKEMTLEGWRTLSMGLHVLKELLEVKKDFAPNDVEVEEMCKLAARCLESSESGVVWMLYSCASVCMPALESHDSGAHWVA